MGGTFFVIGSVQHEKEAAKHEAEDFQRERESVREEKGSAKDEAGTINDEKQSSGDAKEFSMPANYLPNPDAEFQLWLANFVTVAGANVAALGLLPADITALSGAQATFGGNLGQMKALQASAKAAVATKDASRKTVNNQVRSIVRRIQSNPAVTAALKNQLNINPRNTPKTRTPPAQPTYLLASPDSSGVNSLAWNRNGNKPNTTFVIEAMLGASTTFEQIGTTTKTKFDHTGQTPGVKATYRVIAERADMSSLPSQSVTVYGSPVTLVLQKAA